jgi:hypothetical protein
MRSRYSTAENARLSSWKASRLKRRRRGALLPERVVLSPVGAGLSDEMMSEMTSRGDHP